jgi:hypothetical protein
LSSRKADDHQGKIIEHDLAEYSLKEKYPGPKDSQEISLSMPTLILIEIVGPEKYH